MVRLVFTVPVLFLVVFSLTPVFADTGSFPVIFGNVYQINYNANGVKIQDIEPNPTYDELVITVQVSSPTASLDLTIPRALLDSKQNNSDIPFIAVVDGTLANVEEKTPTLTTRTVSLQLTPDNKQIEIIGTYLVVPGPNGGVAKNQSHSTGTTQQIAPTPQTYNNTVSKPPVSNPASIQNHITPQSTTSQASSQTQSGGMPVNMTSQASTGEGIVFTIPYINNVTLNLSQIDWEVIGAISIVIIIVIASTARKRPNKIAKI